MIDGRVYKGGTITLMARIVGADNSTLTASGVSTIKYSVYEISDVEDDSRTAITGHNAVSLTPSNVFYSTLQDDSRWTVDDVGYNFAHIVDVSSNAAFTTIGTLYCVEYVIQPTSGQVIVEKFFVKCV